MLVSCFAENFHSVSRLCRKIMKTVFSRFKFRERSIQYLAVFGINMGIFSTGSHSGWPSSSLPLLTSGNSTINMTTQEGSLLTSVTPLTVPLGCIITAVMMKSMGRKTLLLLCPIPLIASWLLIAMATSKIHLYIGRALGGFIDGAIFNVGPAYISEIADAEVRGLFGTSIMVSFGSGIVLFNVFVTFMSSESIAYLIAALTLPMLFTIPFVPESPYYCLLKGDSEEAELSLKKLKGKQDIQGDLDRISRSILEHGEAKGKVTDILTKKHFRRCICTSIMLSSTQHLSGNSAIQFYLETLFQNSRSISSKTINCIYYVGFFVASIVSPLLVDISGRKTLVLVSTGSTTVTLFATGTFMYFKNSLGHDTYVGYVQLLLLLLQAVTYSSGLHTIPMLVASEIFPSNLVGTALCLINIIYSISISATVFLFERTYYSMGTYVPFFLFGIFCLCGMMLISMFLIETKGKTLEKIQNEIRRSKLRKVGNCDSQ
ncbi:facilitated trehalose transporter Tret1-like isoform X2 [Leptinotarsa decemlineata]|uniref:facilitated trehalose transporter Tret1-like isoform X2 n=1 Tax=Leptinotarsa decemlineata TaxID=7539 RepID=UPI003D305285